MVFELGDRDMYNINESETDPSVVRSNQTAICAYALSRYAAELLSHEIHEGQVFFVLRIPKSVTFQKIQDEFDRDGATPARSYSNELSRLKSIVLRSRQGVRS